MVNGRIIVVGVLLCLVVAGCAFIPRQVDVSSLDGRIHYPRDSFGQTAIRVTFGPFEDRRPSRERLGVGRNKLMMVTTTVGMSGDLAAAFGRMARQNFAAQGISEGPSPISVRGAILEATTDAEGPDHVYVQLTASLMIIDTRSNRPLFHETLRARKVTGVTQVTNEAWEDAFVGAANSLNHQIQVIAAAVAKGMEAQTNESPREPTLAAGSCVVVHSDGFILTAHHVVEGARSIDVLPDSPPVRR